MSAGITHEVLDWIEPAFQDVLDGHTPDVVNIGTRKLILCYSQDSDEDDGVHERFITWGNYWDHIWAILRTRCELAADLGPRPEGESPVTW